jgi:hypothetical protein
MSLHAHATDALRAWTPLSPRQRELRDAFVEHLDVRFLVLAPPAAEPSVSVESDDLRWFSWDGLPTGIEPTIGEMLSTARLRLAHAG